MTKRINIKLRRDILSPERIHRHKNYSNVLRQYERKKRFDRAMRLFIYSLVIAVVVLFLVLGALWVYVRLEKERREDKTNQSAMITVSQKNSLHPLKKS
jgi:hypothetical protein